MFSLLLQFSKLDGAPPPPSYHDIMVQNAEDGVPFKDPGTCTGSVNCILSSSGHVQEAARKTGFIAGPFSARSVMNQIDGAK